MPGERRESAGSASTSLLKLPPATSPAPGAPPSSETTWPRPPSLLSRADALLPRDVPERLELLPTLTMALVARGELAAAKELLAEGFALAETLGDRRLEARMTVTAELQLLWTEAAVPPERILADIDDAVPVLLEAKDYEALAMAETLRFQARDRAGLHGGDRFSLALEYARKAHSRSLENYILGWVCITLHRGTLPVDEAIAYATEIRESSGSTHGGRPRSARWAFCAR